MAAELTLRWSDGSLDLMDWNESDGDSFEIATLADGTDWGNPESVRRKLRTAMLDGSRSTKDRDDNRLIVLKLKVSAPSSSALAAGEQALDLVDGRRCELVWTPPGDLGVAPAVFVVDYADLSHDMDDLAYGRGQLFYTLTMGALPHAYSDEWVTIPAVAKDVWARTVVDSCSSLTGWTASGATLSVTGGGTQISVIPTETVAETTYTVTRTGAVDLTTLRYLGVDAGSVVAQTYKRVQKVEVQSSVGGPWIELPRSGATFDVNFDVFAATGLVDPTVETIRFTFTTTGTSAYIREVVKQEASRSTVNRQQLRTLAVPGSARTPASLEIHTSSLNGLGTAIVYTGPAYNPAISRGALELRVADPANMSGGRLHILPSQTKSFHIPASEFIAGDHVMWMHAAGDTGATGSLTLTVRLLTGTFGVIVSETTVSTSSLTLGAYAMHLLGSVELPPAPLPADSEAVVQFDLFWSGDATDELVLDELLAFNRRGALTIAKLESGFRGLWLDSPTLESDFPSAFFGHEDKAASVPLSLTAQLLAWPGAHRIEPPVTHLYTASSTGDNVTAAGTFRPAWHTHPRMVTS